jgi:hypothetical protein
MRPKKSKTTTKKKKSMKTVKKVAKIKENPGR